MAKTKKRSGRSGRSRSRSRSASMMKPLDVRSGSALKEMEKRIRQGPVTLVLVYADWCGHCHEIMPHWDKAAASPSRSVQAVKVNEKMLPEVNQMMNRSINQQAKPLDVSGYPTIIMVDNQANPMTNVEPVKDTGALTEAMNQVGNIAEETGVVPAPAPAPDLASNMEMEEPIMPMNVSNSARINLANQGIANSASRAELANQGIFQGSMSNGWEGDDMSIKPDRLGEAQESFTRSMAELPKRGGSLYSSLQRSAYTLSDPAILFRAARSMGRRSMGHKSKKRSRRGRKSLKSRKST